MRKLVREMLTSQKLLGISDAEFIPSLTQIALSLYADQQPQLLSAQARVSEYIGSEQNRFERTLEDGRRYLDRILDRRSHREVSPQDVLEMEKRHGIPLPLLEAMLVQQNADSSRPAHQQVYGQRRQSIAGAH